MIQANDIVIFQGDSITDAERDRDLTLANHPKALGCGYANIIASYLLHKQPKDNLFFYNRGIGGNRIIDLYARWKADCLNLNPNVISIMIGVNDTWHEFGRHDGVEVDRYETVYHQMLTYTKQRLPNVRLVLCEPFYLLCGAVTEAWVPEMKQRQEVVKSLASEFDAIFVPFQSALNNVIKYAPPTYWLDDGVHPTAAGHYLLSQVWLEHVIT